MFRKTPPSNFFSLFRLESAGAAGRAEPATWPTAAAVVEQRVLLRRCRRSLREDDVGDELLADLDVAIDQLGELTICDAQSYGH